MKFRKYQWLVVYTMLAIILSSCNLGATPAPTQDVAAIQTEAFNQVLTQVAAASSPTPIANQYSITGNCHTAGASHVCARRRSQHRYTFSFQYSPTRSGVDSAGIACTDPGWGCSNNYDKERLQ